MSISKINHKLVFNQVLPTSSCAITSVIMQPDVNPHAHVGVDVPHQEDAPIPQAPAEVPTTVAEAPPNGDPVPEPLVIKRDVNDLHHLFGHEHFDAIKRSAKYYNIKLRGDVKNCVACALAKIRQKNRNKVTLSKSMKHGD
jgi:hypothetical protein